MGQQFPFNNSVYNYNQQQNPLPGPQGHQLPPPPMPHAMQQQIGAGNNSNPMLNQLHQQTANQNMHHNVQPPPQNNMWNATNNMFPSLGNSTVEKNQSMMQAWLQSKPAPMPQQSPHQIRPPPPPPNLPPGPPPTANPMLRSTAANPLQMVQQQHNPHNHVFNNPPNLPNQSFVSQPMNPPFPQNPPKFPVDLANFNGVNDIASLSTQAAKMMLSNDLDLLAEMRKSDKDSVQFLHNVHFPEKVFGGPMGMTPQGSMQNQAQQQQQQKLVQPNMQFFNSLSGGSGAMHGTYSHLLPPNMSFHDMAAESKETQSRWCMKLMETYGLEEADKFSEILRQISVSMAHNQEKLNQGERENVVLNNMISGDFGSVFKETYPHFNVNPHASQQQHQQPDKFDNFRQMLENDENLSNSLFQTDELDNIFNNYLKNSLYKSPLDAPMQPNLNNIDQQHQHMFQQQTNSQNLNMNFNERNLLNGIDLFNFSKEPTIPEMRNYGEEMASDQYGLHQSVPLYKRRQATQNKNSTDNNLINNKNNLY
jgi:hypothetical protein